MWHDYQFSSLHQSRMEGNVALDCRTNTHHMYRPWARPGGVFINQMGIDPIMPGYRGLKGPLSVEGAFYVNFFRAEWRGMSPLIAELTHITCTDHGPGLAEDFQI